MSIVHPKIEKSKSGAPQGKDPNIVVFDWNEVKTSPGRDSKGVVMTGNFVFEDGKYASKIYATSSSISLPRGLEGDEDKTAYSQVPEFAHPGSPLDVEEWIHDNRNRSLGLAVRVGSCNGEQAYYKTYGTKCNPLRLIVEGTDDNEGVMDVMRFEMSRPSDTPPGRYYGTMTFDTATVVAADATVVNVANGSGEYQLTDNAAATEITSLDNASNGGRYTLIGSGGVNPATLEEDAAFQLLDGASWQGISGARITLAAFKNGPSSFIFVEQSRS